MNEVNMLNIGGIDYNVDDQYARDVIAHSENGLDSQSNLPVSSRHYDEGDYLIGQDRFYYEAITDIEIGDTLVVGTNLRQTILSDEIVRLKNQSSLAVIQCIAFNEVGTTASKDYTAGQYLYWDYGLDAGLYETITAITSGDSFSVGVNIKSANKIIDIVDGLQDSYNITGAKNLCPNNASDTTTTDITWDVLSDGSVQVNGTAAVVGRYLTMGSITLPAGTYTLTTGQANEVSAPVALYCRQNGTSTILGTSNANPTFTLAQNAKVDFYLYTVVTGTAMNVRVFPMCRVASNTDESYVPFAMTNQQLTKETNNFAKKAWALLGTYSDQNVTIPSNFNEIIVCVKETTDPHNGYLFIIPKGLWDTTANDTRFRQGYYESANSYGSSMIQKLNGTMLRLTKIYRNASTVNTTVYIYYR